MDHVVDGASSTGVRPACEVRTVAAVGSGQIRKEAGQAHGESVRRSGITAMLANSETLGLEKEGFANKVTGEDQGRKRKHCTGLNPARRAVRSGSASLGTQGFFVCTICSLSSLPMTNMRFV